MVTFNTKSFFIHIRLDQKINVKIIDVSLKIIEKISHRKSPNKKW